ncbi:MAG: 2OG-Fe(II) oxygenase [Hyphomicrobiales bacterium]|nr:MAG: 2OG-Fe(II) oxygenase [Hyphomicrobiales bacterium]
MVVQGVLSPVDLAAVRADFPALPGPGLFPIASLVYGPVFQRLVGEVLTGKFETLIGRKFGLELGDKPLLVTIRGFSQQRDGRIHKDSKSKLLSGILYLNDIWDESGGRLRLLRQEGDIADFAVEVPPSGGTLVMFMRSENSWHGHLPYVGERRALMFTWMASKLAFQRELGRHSLSAIVKRQLASLTQG